MTNNFYRNFVYTKLLHLITFDNIVSPLNIQKITNLEIAIFNFSVKHSLTINKNWNDPSFVQCYSNKARHLLLNLNPHSYVNNKSLLSRYLNDEFSCVSLCFSMSHIDLFPERFSQALKDNLETDKLSWSSQLDPDTMPDGMFPCTKCKSKRTSFFMLNSRRGDEGSVITVNCLVCRHTWKFS
jgi:DNA-directed RNA polymerase subunit M/transcription elongation factor TFIIS